MRYKWMCPMLLGVLLSCQHRDANKDLRAVLRDYGVKEVDVLEVPNTISVPIDFTPATLETGYHAKLELRAGAIGVDDLDVALAATECKKSAHSVDLRIAIIFYGAGHKRIRSFYYGARGVGGQIDGQPCELSSGLYHWVRKTLRE